MLGKLSVFALALGLWGCGVGEENRAEIKSYVDRLQEFDPLNKKVEEYVIRLKDPSAYHISQSDLEKARNLVDQYLAKFDQIPEINFRQLRLVSDSYGRKLNEAKRQAHVRRKELKNDIGNVNIAVKHIKKETKEHYKGISLLWERHKLPGAFPLKWPDEE